MGYFLEKLAAEAGDDVERRRTVGRTLRDSAIGAGMGAASIGAAGGLAYGGAKAAKGILTRRAANKGKAYLQTKRTIYDNPMDAREARDAALKAKQSAGRLASGAGKAARGIANFAKKNWKWALPVGAAAGALKGAIHGGKEPVEG